MRVNRKTSWSLSSNRGWPLTVACFITPELEAELRQQSFLLSLHRTSSLGSYGPTSRRDTVRRGVTRRIVVPEQGDHLAVGPTVINALVCRSQEDNWLIRQSDLRFEKRRGRTGIDICLLIDASASMLGNG